MDIPRQYAHVPFNGDVQGFVKVGSRDPYDVNTKRYGNTPSTPPSNMSEPEFTRTPEPPTTMSRRLPPRQYSSEPLQGGLIHGVLKPNRSQGKNDGVIDRTALSALADHLTEIGSPLGELVSRHVRGEQSVPFSSLSGDILHHVQTPDGVHQVLGRKGKGRGGKPLTWVSVSQWKKVPLDNGNTRLDKDKSYEFALPDQPTQMGRNNPRRYAITDPSTPVVSVNVPVPTPVQPIPKPPGVSFGVPSPGAIPQAPTQPPAGQTPTALTTPVPQPPQLKAVILPWSPPPRQRMSRSLSKRTVVVK